MGTKKERSMYFTRTETECKCGCGLDNWKPELMKRLHNARVHYGKPMIVTSMCRCTTHNMKVGGSPTSSHLYGWAVDIKVPSDAGEYLTLLAALIGAGFKRIVISNRRLHVDVDPTKPEGVFFYAKE